VTSLMPNLEKIKHKPGALLHLVETLVQAIHDSDMDLSPCRLCGKAVICLPDGLALCRACAATAEDPERIPAI
jgi:hypothetical protein